MLLHGAFGSDTNNIDMSKLNEKRFWLAHPSTVVAIYMKHDWFKMGCSDFFVKWLKDAMNTKNESRKVAIFGMLSMIWQELDSEQKYTVLTEMAKGMHPTDSFNMLLDLYEMFGGGFIYLTIKKSYGLLAKRNWETNYQPGS